MSDTQPLVGAAAQLADAVDALTFPPPVAFVYNPLRYAWTAHRVYLERFGAGTKRVLFLGMNPGPFGMAQTGVPFGEVAVVRDWLGIDVPVGKPRREHPRKPVLGFACGRSEVIGRRLWRFVAARFGTADCFFKEHFVVNYCPLLFLEDTPAGRNLAPDGFRAEVGAALFAACDAHLRTVVCQLRCEWAIGVGAFAEGRLRKVFEDTPLKIGRIPHPSPASPAANRGWGAMASAALQELGVWRTAG